VTTFPNTLVILTFGQIAATFVAAPLDPLDNCVDLVFLQHYVDGIFDTGVNGFRFDTVADASTGPAEAYHHGNGLHFSGKEQSGDETRLEGEHYGV
jgi:hypothetical protein